MMGHGKRYTRNQQLAKYQTTDCGHDSALSNTGLDPVRPA